MSGGTISHNTTTNYGDSVTILRTNELNLAEQAVQSQTTKHNTGQ
jgi:hypothetical protein